MSPQRQRRLGALVAAVAVLAIAVVAADDGHLTSLSSPPCGGTQPIRALRRVLSSAAGEPALVPTTTMVATSLAGPSRDTGEVNAVGAPSPQTSLGRQCQGVWSPFWADRAASERVRQSLKAPSEAPLLDLLDRHQCPFGRALPGDVTWPSPQESVRHVVAPLSPLKVMAVAYSYLPYLLVARSFLAFARHKGTRQLSILLWVLLLVASNECLFKRIWREPRPGNMLQVRDFSGRFVGSCLRSCGMPSSHAALGTGWLMLLFLDGIYRVRPFALGRKTQTMPIRPDAVFSDRVLTCLRLYFWVPWSDCDLLTHTEFSVFISAWFVLLMPVPFMRVVLYDHSFSQVAVGSCLGMFLALIWWRVVRHLQRRYQSREGDMVFYDLLVHNHKIPQFHMTGSGDLASEMPSVLGLAT